MKYCLECDRKYDDLIELCPECAAVLVLGKQRSRSAHSETGLGRYTGDDTANHILYAGSRADVDYLKSVLQEHNLPCSIERAGYGQWELTISPLYAEAAEELLEDLYPAAHRYDTFQNMDDLDSPFTDFDNAGKFQVDTFGSISKISMLIVVSILTILAIFGVHALISFFIET